MNPTWKQFKPAKTNELAYSTLTLPSIYVEISAWVGYSVCLRKTDIGNVDGFSLQPLAEPISDEYVLCVSYPVPGSTTKSVRYKLWEGVGEVVSATLYQGQLIGPGAYLELWTTINSPNPVAITEDIVIETGLTYSRMGGNGGCTDTDSGNCSGGGGGSGTQGPPGPPGEAATIAVGTTTTLAAGEDATVDNSGTSSAAVFNFGIPRGEQGPPGEGTVEVGDTITGAPGTDASVTNVGTPTDVILEFTIPRGNTGSTGPAGPAPSGTGVVVVNSGVAAVITTSAELAAKISDETGSGALVFANSPILVTPALGTPSSGNLSNCTFPTLNQNTTGNAATATALQTPRTINGVSFDGTANITITVAPPSGTGLIAVTGGVYDSPISTSAALAAKISDETGSGSLVFATSPALVTPALGTPTSGILTSCTGLPIATGISGLGTNVAAFLATPSSANLASAVTDETGTGALVFNTSPTFVTPILGTPTSGNLTNCTGPWPTASGTSGALAKFTGTSALGNSIVTEASTTLTVAGNLTFSGSTTPGLVPNNLTALEIGNLIAPPTGSTVFNETTLQLNMWDGSVWSELRTGNYLPLAGGTMTGNIVWDSSATTIPGLRLNNLTTTQRNATSPAAGALVWNTTTSRVNSYTGSAWVDGWVRTTGDTMTGALAIASGTLTASAPAIDISQTWNSGAVAFTGVKFNVTDTTSSSSSLLFDFQYNGTTRINGTRGGTVNCQQLIIVNDVVLVRDASNVLALRNSTTAQRQRVYNTYTDSSNYERGFVEWVSNVFRIGTEKLGTGVARALEFIVDGTTRLSISTAGVPTFTTDQLRLSTFKTPSSASDTGTAGTICYDTNYIYICTASNTWKRVAVATW